MPTEYCSGQQGGRRRRVEAGAGELTQSLQEAAAMLEAMLPARQVIHTYIHTRALHLVNPWTYHGLLPPHALQAVLRRLQHALQVSGGRLLRLRRLLLRRSGLPLLCRLAGRGLQQRQQQGVRSPVSRQRNNPLRRRRAAPLKGA